jgi:hypothetical protein
MMIRVDARDSGADVTSEEATKRDTAEQSSRPRHTPGQAARMVCTLTGFPFAGAFVRQRFSTTVRGEPAGVLDARTQSASRIPV